MKKALLIASLILGIVAPTLAQSPSSTAELVTGTKLLKVCVNKTTNVLSLSAQCRDSNVELPFGTAALGTRAYGFVNRDGELDRKRSSLNVSSRRLNKQVYCVKVKDVDPRTSSVPVASVDFSLSECEEKQILPISTANSGCKFDEFGFTIPRCTVAQTNGVVYSYGVAFSFIIP